MDVFEALYTTRAMRRVTEEPIPEEILKQMVDAYHTTGGNILAVTEVPREQTNKYGKVGKNLAHLVSSC